MATADSTFYQFRMSPHEKAAMFDVFEWMGMKPAQAFRLFIRHVENTKKLPFEIEHIPNKKTREALMNPVYVGPFDNLDDLFAELNI